MTMAVILRTLTLAWYWETGRMAEREKEGVWEVE